MKISAIEGKIKRSGIEFLKTSFWFNHNPDSNKEDWTRLLLHNDERILIIYQESSDYRWVLTSQRLFIPNELITIKICDLLEANFEDLELGKTTKLENDSINLRTKNATIKLYLEENSWHLFIDIFKFIITK